MMNKELKKGGQVWIYSHRMLRSYSYPVISVKKTGTLVTVVIRCENALEDKYQDVTLYGHASSSLLSGYERKYNFGRDVYYTCDFDLIEKWSNERQRDSKYEEIGRNLKKLLSSLGI